MTNTAKINSNGETPETIPLSSGVRQGCSLSPLFSDTVLQAAVRTVRQEKEINELQIRKEEECKLILRDSRI